ncbi:MAG: ZIP family metal transporter [Gemmatimonadota bacterium]
MIVATTYAALAALANVLGGVIVTASVRRNRMMLGLLVAFGAGFMLAVALLEMLPHGLNAEHGITLVLAGYLAVHLTQHTMTPHFHFGEETHHEAMVSRGIGGWALAGLLPHAFFDGVAIAGGFLESARLGLLVFGAVLLHKIPTGVSLASVMLASGNSSRQAIAAVTVIGLATVVGAGVTPAVGLLADHGLAFAAGVTVYVAASNLIPESQREPGWRVSGGVFVGVAAFYLLRMLLPTP